MRSVLRMLLPGAMLAMTLAGLVVAGSAMDLPFPPPTNGGGHLVADLPFPPPTNGGGHLV
ncbi:MAG TPA: hypothetical protein VEJ38_14795 [Candidatus Acidoferrales bacterium]|nr:hypothetical protein [Candidatus Acidoferrales bacterium]